MTKDVSVAKRQGREPRMEYVLPSILFWPTVVAFFLLNYLAWFTTVNADGTDLILPPKVFAMQKARAAGAVSAGADHFFDPQLFLEDTVMRSLFRVSRRIGGIDGVRAVWCLAWIAHCMELGIAVRICLSCGVRPVVFVVYCAMVLCGGFTQLLPMIYERDRYLSLLAKSKIKRE